MKFLLLSLLLTTSAFAKDFKFVGQDYPPFNSMEKDKPAGAMVEAVMAMCAITKDNCTIEVWPLKRAMALLETGEIHGVISLLKNSDRDVFGNFLPGIIKSDMIYINHTSKPSITTPAELKGWTVGAVAASQSAKIAKKDTDAAGGGAKTEEENNNETVLKKIANDRYGDKGAIIMNEDVYAYLSKKESITNLKKLFSAKSDDFGVYFSKKSVDQASIDKFTAALDQLKKSGELNKILAKHGFKH